MDSQLEAVLKKAVSKAYTSFHRSYFGKTRPTSAPLPMPLDFMVREIVQSLSRDGIYNDVLFALADDALRERIGKEAFRRWKRAARSKQSD